MTAAPGAARTHPLVLVVDDHPAVRALMEQLLDAGGYDVVAVDRYDAVVATVGDQQPDIVLLGVLSPTGRGVEVLAELREHSDVPVILVSGFADNADKALGRRAGAQD